MNRSEATLCHPWHLLILTVPTSQTWTPATRRWVAECFRRGVEGERKAVHTWEQQISRRDRAHLFPVPWASLPITLASCAPHEPTNVHTRTCPDHTSCSSENLFCDNAPGPEAERKLIIKTTRPRSQLRSQQLATRDKSSTSVSLCSGPLGRKKSLSLVPDRSLVAKGGPEG